MSGIMKRFYTYTKPDDAECIEAALAGDCAFAYFLDDEPVSFCTTHHGYMSDRIGNLCVQGTLEQHRCRGYGKATASATTDNILRQGRIPVWGTSIDNIASIKTAKAIGYQVFCYVLEIRHR